MNYMHRTLTLFALGLSAALLVLSCSSSSVISGKAQKAAVSPEGPQGAGAQSLPRDTELSGKNWLLAGIRVAGTLYPLEPEHGSASLLIFRPNGTLSGSTGTNTFMGTWKTGSPKKNGTIPLSISTNGITKVAAPSDTAAQFEQNLLASLASVKSVQTEKGSIRFLDGSGETLLVYIFRASSSF